MYFVTVCTYGRKCLFGKIINGQMIMNDLGQIVAEEWVKTGEIRSNIELDVWVVMPNHIHGIIVINDRNPTCRDDQQVVPVGPPTKSIGAIMSGFKSAATKQVNVLRQTPGVPLWQRNYWDHVIRNEADLNRLREYVATNPLRWETDTLRERSS